MANQCKKSEQLKKLQSEGERNSTYETVEDDMVSTECHHYQQNPAYNVITLQSSLGQVLSSETEV